MFLLEGVEARKRENIQTMCLNGLHGEKADLFVLKKPETLARNLRGFSGARDLLHRHGQKYPLEPETEMENRGSADSVGKEGVGMGPEDDLERSGRMLALSDATETGSAQTPSQHQPWKL